MIYQVLFSKSGRAKACVQGSAGQQKGEVYVDVFTAETTIFVEADTPDEAIEKAKEIYGRMGK